MVKILSAVLFILFFAATSTIWAASARVDRTTIQEGETFALVVQGEDGEPDFSALEALFEVLSTSKSTQMSIVNGRMSTRNEWQVLLMPQRSGRLVIPAIAVGKEKTQPIQIEVVPASAQSNQGAGQDIFIEASAKPENPYVQAQVIYTVKLFHAVQIQDGGLSQPKIDNVVIERVGDDVRYQTQRGGRLFQVTERRYALFPQQSGRISIPPTVFSGNAISQKGNFSFDPFNRFFSQNSVQPIRLNSAAITLNVRPKPAQFSGKDWLPSERLVLTQTWSGDVNKLKVGEPITRTLRIQAVGLTAAQLPAFAMSANDAFKIYSDQPTQETKPDGGNLIGVREDKLAVVATKTGQFSFPPIKIQWWNTQTDRMEEATLPIETVTVVGTTSANTSLPSSGPLLNATQADDANVTQPSTTATGVSAGFWPWLTAGFAFAWLFTLALWWRGRSAQTAFQPTQDTNVSPKSRELEKAIEKAAKSNDASAARRAITVWAQHKWPELGQYTLDRVGQQLGKAYVADEFKRLDQSLYQSKQSSWDGKAFWDTISPHLRGPEFSTKERNVRIPPLYS